jgi:diacylglycerol kinase family enzyme
MNVLVINNLTSGLRDAAIFDFARLFSRDGDNVAIRSTGGTTSIKNLLADATSFDLVVASGGDGTISEVCYVLRGSGIPVLPFPAGTGNLLSLNLDQPEEPFALAQMARELQTLDFDLGEISYMEDGVRVSRGFMIIAGAGYDASIMATSRPFKDPLGPMAYLMGALINPLPTVATLDIECDGESIHTDGIGVLVANFSKIYADISLTHANDARDGKLEVLVLKQRNAIELIPALFTAFLDRDGSFPDRTDAVEAYTATEVRITAEPGLNIQYDGEALEATTPLEVRIIPGGAKLVVSKEFARNNS